MHFHSVQFHIRGLVLYSDTSFPEVFILCSENDLGTRYYFWLASIQIEHKLCTGSWYPLMDVDPIKFSYQHTEVCCILLVYLSTVHAAPNEGDIRLIGGSSNSEGRVEVYHNGQFGTVCDNQWDLTDANVVCQQLGFGGATSAPGQAAFGEGSGPILYDNVACSGTEARLVDCPNAGIGIHNCAHADDAGVVCYAITGQLSSA